MTKTLLLYPAFEYKTHNFLVFGIFQCMFLCITGQNVFQILLAGRSSIQALFKCIRHMKLSSWGGIYFYDLGGIVVLRSVDGWGANSNNIVRSKHSGACLRGCHVLQLFQEVLWFLGVEGIIILHTFNPRNERWWILLLNWIVSCLLPIFKI